MSKATPPSRHSATPPAPHYQAVVFDLDGTAIPNAEDGRPSRHLIETIARHRHHLHLIAATGRPLIYALPIISQLGLTEPCIVSGGTIVIDPATQAVLQRTTLGSSSAQAVLDLFLRYPYHIYIRDERISEGLLAADKAIIEDVDIIVVESVDHTDIPKILEQLATLPDVAASTVPPWSGVGQTFTITSAVATKEQAVATVLRRLGVPKSATIGIGDGDNDLHLFASVGLKVAMGNASDQLKAAADLIAPSIDADGLAAIIERYSP